MKIEQELKDFKKLFDAELEKFLNLKISEAEKISPLAKALAKTLRDYILQSGKRVRPALMYYTYLALGGKSQKEALCAAMAPEFMHTFLIIHDDIIDRDNLRRGNPSLHYIYRLSKEKSFIKADEAVHYGNSQAISVGNQAFGFVNEVIAKSNFEGIIKNRIFEKISRIIFNTTIGEFSDVFAVTEKNVSEKDVLTILEYKTARYTIEGPIHLGAIMAEAGRKTMNNLSGYAVPLGIAFQIQDDILGVFGSEKETGKPVGADLREGKKTLLLVKALEFGSAAQKKELKNAAGNSEISRKQIERVRQIIIDTGSLDYSKKMAEKLAAKSREALAKSGFDSRSKEFFTDVAEFIIKRKY